MTFYAPHSAPSLPQLPRDVERIVMKYLLPPSAFVPSDWAIAALAQFSSRQSIDRFCTNQATTLAEIRAAEIRAAEIRAAEAQRKKRERQNETAKLPAKRFKRPLNAKPRHVPLAVVSPGGTQ
jgi:hypothetical protein